MEAPRTISSNAAPAGRRNKSEIAGTTRPELHVIKGNRTDESRVRRGFEQLLTWTRTRRTPLLHLVVAVVFLVVCLLGSLTLRTQMVQNSFEANQIETNITSKTTRPSSTSLKHPCRTRRSRWAWCRRKGH